MLGAVKLATGWLHGALIAALALACTNDPYPPEDNTRKVLYRPFSEAPKTLDPAVAYTTEAHEITGMVNGTLLEYHYLRRPYSLVPGLARAVPHAESRGDQTVYRFDLYPDLLFQEDACFPAQPGGARTRVVSAHDVAFQLMRLADPEVNSPALEPFAHLVDLLGFRRRLSQLRAADPALAALPVHQQYARAGRIAGVRVLSDTEFELVLGDPYPQILYWFTMPFTTPMPWEAVAYYDGREGRPHLADHPVGTGPYRLVEYDKQSRIVLGRNQNWHGVRHPEWHAPGAVFPTDVPAADLGTIISPQVRGAALPFIERVELLREKERIPAFNKFLQGYYDSSGIVKESFDKLVQNDQLSQEMTERGISLRKTVEPAVYYLGFNMDDRLLGAPGGEPARKLRQAMSLAIDAREYLRLFYNGRGVPAQSPLPPGLFGYAEGYQNPMRVVDLERAKRLLAEAGYPGGIDPKTRGPLRLTFDTGDTSANGRLHYTYYVNSWRRIGLDVDLQATNYNRFQEKMRDGAFQIFSWGWVADYPDPENFMFLLWSKMSRKKNNGPNTANYAHPDFDALFLRMKAMDDGPERLAIIHAMLKHLEQDCPWIPLFHPEQYSLFHGWLRNVKPMGLSVPQTKYYDLDPSQRAVRRREWNRPVLWPAFAALGLLLAILVPGVVTFFRERQ
jgi:ABC-type transport system substrate-binding protein